MPTLVHRKVGSTTVDVNQRVILLLDLDCFYAQCECVRLGFDVITTSLALLQWNSVLAVTYPARDNFGIKRGDSWEEIEKKVKQANLIAVKHNNNNKNDDKKDDNNKNNDNKNNKDENDTNNDNPIPFERKECYAIHVPILTTNSSTESKQTDRLASLTNNDNWNEIHNDKNNTSCPVQQQDDDDNEYEQIFHTSTMEQQRARQLELGVRHFSTEGKASIERYRIASRRIFETVFEYIDEKYGSDQIILERASIDEFFLDVTNVCYKNKITNTISETDIKHAMNNTKIVGQQQQQQNQQNEANIAHANEFNDLDAAAADDDVKAIKIGCYIAHSIRTHVFHKLGFTLSAGISYNKTIAKLSTTYGKPNGQAVTFPNAVQYLLNNTEIRKWRNLGGKLGKKVLHLLPSDAVPTVGAIAKYLSLPELHSGLSSEKEAYWVYQLSRGIDTEPVLSKNESGIPKSITCFKALPFLENGHTLDDAASWIRLLAQELISRVERDSSKHHRYPKTCTVAYAYQRRPQSKSIRMNFPCQRLSSKEAKIEALIEQVPKLIRSKEGNDFRCTRIGLCAVDFVSKASTTNAIESYFTTTPASVTMTITDPPSPTNQVTMTASNLKSKHDEQAPVITPSNKSHYGNSSELFGPVDACTDSSTPPKSDSVANNSRGTTINPYQRRSFDRSSAAMLADLELAKKLQAGFNSEHRLFEALDNKKKKATNDKSRKSTNSILNSTMNKKHLFSVKPKNNKVNHDKHLDVITLDQENEITSFDKGESITPKQNKNDHNLIISCPDDDDDENDEHNEDQDFVLAKKLQAAYDREHHVLNGLDTKTKQDFCKKRAILTNNHLLSSSKKKKMAKGIDTFFQKR